MLHQGEKRKIGVLRRPKNTRLSLPCSRVSSLLLCVYCLIPCVILGEIGGMRAFEAQTVLRSDDHHKASIYCLAFSPDSALIATGEA